MHLNVLPRDVQDGKIVFDAGHVDSQTRAGKRDGASLLAFLLCHKKQSSGLAMIPYF